MTRSDRESERKSGRARLTKRPRMLGATAARTKEKKCHVHPKHQNLQTVLNPAASGQDEIGRAEIGNLEALPLPH